MITLPADFIHRTCNLLSDEFVLLKDALSAEPPVSIRINKLKSVRLLPYDNVLWSELGYYLPSRPAFTFDPLFHAGAYYVQEASSMFLEQAIKSFVNEPAKVLDLCAAPGGKSTHLISTLPPDSLIVSNEVIRSRSQILSENITKWGNPHTIVTNNDPSEIGRLKNFFDVIVADVPCSGEGMFRKDPDSVNEWSVANVNLCSSRQKRIISDVWSALKEGGFLIYSTCTYNTEENEDNIHYMVETLGAEVLSLSVDPEWQIGGPLKYNYPVYRFFPHKVRGEGFFLAVLRKRERDRVVNAQKSKKEKKNIILPVPSDIKQWLYKPDSYIVERQGEIITAFPENHYDDYKYLSQNLKLLSWGINLGKLKGNTVIPAHALAMSIVLNKNMFTTIDIEWGEAIKYLKRETLLLPSLMPNGYILLTYKGQALGFVKNLGNRANNLYPHEWKIRTGYIPEQISLFY